MEPLIGVPRARMAALRARMVLWALPIVADELRRRPGQAVGIWRRFRRMYRTANMMAALTKPMKLGNRGIKMSVYVPHWPSKAIESRARRALRNDFVPPEQVTLAITDECPYRCRHCSNARGNREPLPLPRLIDLVKEIQDLGASWLNIGGGEPSLVFDRALATVKAADERSETWLNTIGFGLDPDKIKQLKDAGLFGGRVSIHSCDPDAHDEFVGYPGAFGIAVRTIESFRKQDMFAVLSAAIPESAITEEATLAFMNLGRDIGAGFVEIIPIRPSGRAVIGCTHAELKGHHVKEDFFRRLNNDPDLLDYPAASSAAYLETPDRFGCVAGSERLYISASGDIQPCPLVNLAVGNVMDEPLETIWKRLHGFIPGPRAQRLCSQLGPLVDEQVRMSPGAFDVLPLPPSQSNEILVKMGECDLPKVWSL